MPNLEIRMEGADMILAAAGRGPDKIPESSTSVLLGAETAGWCVFRVTSAGPAD